MGRQQHATNIIQRQIHRFTKEIVTRDEYELVIKELLRIASEGKLERDRLKAIEMLQQRIEGKLPDTVLHHVQNNLTLDDILPRDNNDE